VFNRQRGQTGTEREREREKVRMTKRESLGRRRGGGGGRRTERGGLHWVGGVRSFLNGSFIQEHFVCIRALVLCSYCGGLSRGTVQARDTVVIHISHIYLLADALNKNKCINTHEKVRVKG